MKVGVQRQEGVICDYCQNPIPVGNPVLQIGYWATDSPYCLGKFIEQQASGLVGEMIEVLVEGDKDVGVDDSIEIGEEDFGLWKKKGVCPIMVVVKTDCTGTKENAPCDFKKGDIIKSTYTHSSNLYDVLVAETFDGETIELPATCVEEFTF